MALILQNKSKITSAILSVALLFSLIPACALTHVNFAFAGTNTASAFAIYSADDNSLCIYKRESVPSIGETFEGKTVTDVYTDFEDKTFSSSNTEAPGWRTGNYRGKIKTIEVVDSSFAPVNLTWYFYWMSEVEKIDLSKMDASKVSSIKKMCSGCFNLLEVDISSLDTSTFTESTDLQTFIAAFGLCKVTLGDKWNINLADKQADLRFYECPEGEYKQNDGLHEGQRFKGKWTDGTNQYALSEIPMKKKATYWWDEVPRYDVKFDANGGTFDEQSSQTIKVLEGEKVDVNAYVPTNSSKVFGGWYTSQICDDASKFNADTKIAENVTLYAKWLDAGTKTYTVKFTTGMKKLSIESQVAYPNTDGAYYVFKPNTDDIKSAGYGFEGSWQVKTETGLQTFDFENDDVSLFESSMSDGVLELVAANLTAHTFNITYNGLQTGDTNTLNPSTFTVEDDSIDLKDATPLASRNVVFAGWRDDEGNLVSQIDTVNTPNNVTVCAKWYKNTWETSDFTFSGDGKTITGVDPDIKDKVDYVTTVNLPSTGPNGEVITAIGEGIYHCGVFGYEGKVRVKLDDGTWDDVYTYHAPVYVTNIPASVKSLGEYAFAGLKGTQIKLPEGLEAVGAKAFQQTNLSSIALPSTVKELGAAIFAESHNLSEVTLPEGITSIPASTFLSCESLKKIHIPNSVKTICAHAFDGVGIQEANMPTSLVTIEEYAFYNHQLKSITLPSTTKSVAKCAFYLVYEKWEATLASLTLNEGLTSIGMAAFGGSLLTEVDLPSTVTTLDTYAFYDGGKGKPGNVILRTKNKTQLTETDTFKPNGVGHEVVFVEDKKDDSGDDDDDDDEEVTKVTMFRLYNRWTGEHFYTSDTKEKAYLVSVGWTDEGIGWYAPSTSKTQVWRLYNKYVEGGDHHYTTDTQERDTLVKAGWISEGRGWYSADKNDEGAVGLYRQYNPFAVTGTHNYTVNKKENDNLVSLGWRAEGYAWWGLE